MKLFKNWWLITIKGVFSIIFGILALMLPKTAVLTILTYFGLVILISGLFIVIGAFSYRKDTPNWSWWLVEGGFDMLVGGLIVIHPLVTAEIFVFVLAIWVVVIGIIQIISAVNLKGIMQNWWILLFSGVLSLFLGLLILTHPLRGTLTLVSSMGLFIIIFGILLLVISGKLKNLNAEQ